MFYLLDVVDVTVSKSFDWMPLIVVSATILLEWAVMLLLKYNPWKKALLDSLIVNAASLLLGYVLIRYMDSLFNSYQLVNLLALFLITAVVETGILYLLNRAKPWQKTVITGVVINVASYLAFFLLIQSGVF
ncbi:MAG: hypothetical protein IPP93_18405 [Chitinophagaceae bacterium]|nr:hypothetical protein [Chitinophagaceae bacterium]MBL0333906.1 hypothetical protein [Chitinophagaceae bacterium]